MPIDLELTKPMVEILTTTKTYVAISITNMNYDLSEKTASIAITKTTDAGIIETETITLRGDDYANLMAQAANPGEMLVEFGTRICADVVMSHFSIAATVV